jgi:transcriptional regulator with XRE-family HTH domain
MSGMISGDRIRGMREEKKLSQGDIEKRTGLLRRNISRVENGHTVPAIQPLEKIARALECPRYQLFYFTKARSHRNCRTSPSEHRRMTLDGQC